MFSFYIQFRQAASRLKIDPGALSDVICDFSREPLYQKGLNNAEAFLAVNSIEYGKYTLNKMHEYFTNLPFEERFFTHGDLIPANIFGENGLLDFDKCGFYPASYELAYLASKSLSFDSVKNLEDYLMQEIQKFSPINQVAFYYFAFVYYSRKSGVKSSDVFIMALWQRLLIKVKEGHVEL